MSNNVIRLFPAAQEEPIHASFDDEQTQGAIYDPQAGPPRSRSLDQTYAASRYKIWSTRAQAEQAKWAEADVMTAVVNAIIKTELQAGSYFILTTPDRTPYMIEGLTKQVFQLSDHSPDLFAYFWY